MHIYFRDLVKSPAIDEELPPFHLSYLQGQQTDDHRFCSGYGWIIPCSSISFPSSSIIPVLLVILGTLFGLSVDGFLC